MSDAITAENWREFIPEEEDIDEILTKTIGTPKEHMLERMLTVMGSFAYQELGAFRALTDTLIDHFSEIGKPCRIIFTLAGDHKCYTYGVQAFDEETWNATMGLLTGTMITAVHTGLLLTSAWDVQCDDEKAVDRYVFELSTDPATHMQQMAYCRADKFDMMVKNRVMRVVDYPADTSVRNCEWHGMLDELDGALRTNLETSGRMA